jgi:hypothetical protein
VEYQVRVERVSPRHLAAARARASRPELGPTIIRLLDLVWPLLRAQQVRTGHNVVIYLDDRLDIEAGVEVFEPFEPTDAVHPTETPSGEVVTTTHWGEYSEVSGAYAALDRWRAETGRRFQAPSWEVYGDWSDDPATRQMDVFQRLAPQRA